MENLRLGLVECLAQCHVADVTGGVEIGIQMPLWGASASVHCGLLKLGVFLEAGKIPQCVFQYCYDVIKQCFKSLQCLVTQVFCSEVITYRILTPRHELVECWYKYVNCINQKNYATI